MVPRKYSKPERLADVLALIQVLALDRHAHRSASGLEAELQGKPRSANDWKSIAIEHPEFFRVNPDEKHAVSLVARHVVPRTDNGVRELDINLVGKLFEAAIDLHDREVSRRVNWKAALPTLLGVLLGGFLTVGGTYFSEKVQLGNQIELQKHQNAREAYSRLMGRRFATTQLYVSRYEALIFSDYHEARWKLAGSPKDSLDFTEATRWMHRSEELVFEIVKNNQSLYEDLGGIRTTFADTGQLRALIDTLSHLKALKIAGPASGEDAKGLKQWKEQAVRQLQALVDTEVGKPFEALLAYLFEELREG